MSTLLRISFKDQDFIIQILSEKPSTQSMLEVLHRGTTYHFVRVEGRWSIQELPQDPKLSEELQQIANTLALRFRGNTAKAVATHEA